MQDEGGNNVLGRRRAPGSLQIAWGHRVVQFLSLTAGAPSSVWLRQQGSFPGSTEASRKTSHAALTAQPPGHRGLPQNQQISQRALAGGGTLMRPPGWGVGGCCLSAGRLPSARPQRDGGPVDGRSLPAGDRWATAPQTTGTTRKRSREKRRRLGEARRATGAGGQQGVVNNSTSPADDWPAAGSMLGGSGGAAAGALAYWQLATRPAQRARATLAHRCWLPANGCLWPAGRPAWPGRPRKISCPAAAPVAQVPPSHPAKGLARAIERACTKKRDAPRTPNWTKTLKTLSLFTHL